MPLSTMWFSFTGRLNRARFWLASIMLIVVGLVLSPIPALSWVLIATSPLSLAALIAVRGWSVMPIASAGLLFVLFVYLSPLIEGFDRSCACSLLLEFQ
jgi:uncharacterized membrane protein YhaH (DUF805 family)